MERVFRRRGALASARRQREWPVRSFLATNRPQEAAKPLEGVRTRRAPTLAPLSDRELGGDRALDDRERALDFGLWVVGCHGPRVPPSGRARSGKTPA